MAVTADIVLKSGKNIIINNLKSIDTPNSSITNFSEFYIHDPELLNFVGASSCVAVNATSIEYVEFKNYQNINVELVD